MPPIALSAPKLPSLLESLSRYLPFLGPRDPGNSHDAPASKQSVQALDARHASQSQWIHSAAAACEAAARGDLDVRLIRCHESPELERLARAINDLLDRTEAFVLESALPLEAANQQRFYRRVVLRGMLGSFRRASELINRACRELAREHAALSESTENRRALADQFDVSVQKVVSALVSSATRANAAVHELAAAAGSANSASGAASNNVPASEIKSSSPVRTPSANAAPNAPASKSASASRELNTVVAELVEASQRIGGVVKLISQIAAQTNLLALNATIEAARAGEVGRGFGVVATEVKSLSQQTAKATDQIRREITAVRVAAQSTAEMVGSMSQRISEMSEISSHVSEQAGELSGSVDNFLRTIRTS